MHTINLLELDDAGSIPGFGILFFSVNLIALGWLTEVVGVFCVARGMINSMALSLINTSNSKSDVVLFRR